MGWQKQNMLRKTQTCTSLWVSTNQSSHIKYVNGQQANLPRSANPEQIIANNIATLRKRSANHGLANIAMPANYRHANQPSVPHA